MTDTNIQIQQEGLQHYSKEFAQKLIRYFFIDHTHITGKDILNFCDIKQINFLVLKNLFERWQEETQRIKSPFFDYENQEVQKALSVFMNALSQYIKVEKEHFARLLPEAVKDALLLVLHPQKYYENQLQKPSNDFINVAKLESVQKYIQFNKDILKKFIEAIGEFPKPEVPADTALDILNKVFQDNAYLLEPIDWRIEQFSEIYPLDIQQILKKETNSRLLEDVALKPELELTQPINAHIKDSKPTKNLYETDDDAQKTNAITLNDLFKKEEEKQRNLSDAFQNAKTANIRSSMSLNQKFQFINKLFQGDNFAFNDAIDRLENCETFEEVRRLVNQEYALKYHWDFEGDDTKNFFEILARRFS
jgi:hypothetical protein